MVSIDVYTSTPDGHKKLVDFYRVPGDYMQEVGMVLFQRLVIAFTKTRRI